MAGCPRISRCRVAQGGIGLARETMSWFIVAMQVGMWLGYVSFGYIADAIGRKRVYVTYLLMASVLLPLYGSMQHPARAAAARAVRGVLRDGVLQRLRCGDGGDLSDVDSRDRDGHRAVERQQQARHHEVVTYTRFRASTSVM